MDHDQKPDVIGCKAMLGGVGGIVPEDKPEVLGFDVFPSLKVMLGSTTRDSKRHCCGLRFKRSSLLNYA